MPIVHAKPSDFVNFLTNPGLNAVAGRIPLKQYVCLNKKNGGNAEISALLTGLRTKAIRDPRTRETIDETVGATEINLLWKGQGHWRAFIDFIGSPAGRAIMRKYGFLLPDESLSTP